jgi:hypothetical protein
MAGAGRWSVNVAGCPAERTTRMLRFVVASTVTANPWSGNRTHLRSRRSHCTRKEEAMRTYAVPTGDLVLDVSTLRAWQTIDEDCNPVLVLKDDDRTVVLRYTLGGLINHAIWSAEDLSDESRLFMLSLTLVKARRRRLRPKRSQDS